MNKYIKIRNEFDLYSVWVIEDEKPCFFNISLYSDRAIITTINKSKCYVDQSDPKFLYSETVISTIEKFNFAFGTFKTIVLE